MAVPAHDERDFDFARAFGLPIRQVVAPVGGEVDPSEPYVEHTEGEVLVNSGEFDGLPADEGGRRIVERLERDGRGRFAVNFRLRDWGFSRQRYWGCPIPVVYCDGLRDRSRAGRASYRSSCRTSRTTSRRAGRRWRRRRTG